jgi:hypothetical protein
VACPHRSGSFLVLQNRKQLCYTLGVKKRFYFSLDDELHEALKQRSSEEQVSMAAVCRESLFFHLQEPERVDTTGPMWNCLKRQVKEYLHDVEHKDTLGELSEFLGLPFQPDEVPDAMFGSELEPEVLPQSFPVVFGPGGLKLHGFHSRGLERCRRPFKKVPLRYDPDSDPVARLIL